MGGASIVFLLSSEKFNRTVITATAWVVLVKEMKPDARLWTYCPIAFPGFHRFSQDSPSCQAVASPRFLSRAMSTADAGKAAGGRPWNPSPDPISGFSDGGGGQLWQKMMLFTLRDKEERRKHLLLHYLTVWGWSIQRCRGSEGNDGYLVRPSEHF